MYSLCSVQHIAFSSIFDRPSSGSAKSNFAPAGGRAFLVAIAESKGRLLSQYISQSAPSAIRASRNLLQREKESGETLWDP